MADYKVRKVRKEQTFTLLVLLQLCKISQTERLLTTLTLLMQMETYGFLTEMTIGVTLGRLSVHQVHKVSRVFKASRVRSVQLGRKEKLGRRVKLERRDLRVFRAILELKVQLHQLNIIQKL
jgi:hypothetical protein